MVVHENLLFLTIFIISVTFWYISGDKLLLQEKAFISSYLRTRFGSSSIFPAFKLERKQQKQEQLLTILYADHECSKNSTVYLTPVFQCYNAQNESLLNNNAFGKHDIFDEIVPNKHDPVALRRSFFKSSNGSCSGGVTDSFNYLPLNECIGPFGSPRPWGVFECVKDFQSS